MVIERGMRIKDKFGNTKVVANIDKQLNEVVLTDEHYITRITRTIEDFLKEYTDCHYTYNDVDFTLAEMSYGIEVKMEGVNIIFDKDFFDEKKAMRTVKRYIDSMEDVI